jgi:hypothetical protein
LFWQAWDEPDDSSDEESAVNLPWDEYELEGKRKMDIENPPRDEHGQN